MKNAPLRQPLAIIDPKIKTCFLFISGPYLGLSIIIDLIRDLVCLFGDIATITK